MKHPAIHAVLFDVYGTLLLPGLPSGPPPSPPRSPDLDPSSLPSLLETRIRHHHQHSPHPFPEIDIRTIWKEILPHLTPQEIETYALDYENHTFPCHPMPGASTLLLSLHQYGIPLGIVSNAQFLTPPLLARSVGFWPFDPSLISWSYQQLRAKPDPALFLPPIHVLEKRGISRCNILYIGNDVAKDIVPARSLGLSTALLTHPSTVRWHHHSPGDFPDTLLLETLADLPLPPGAGT